MLLDVLGEADLVDLADLCSRSLADPPSANELAGALFAPDQPARVRGDPEVGVVATVEHEGCGHVRLLVVDPDHRGRGLGHALLDAAEADLATLGSITTGADPPYSLWPGVPVTETACMCLFESRHYARGETNFHMAIDLATIPDDPGGHDMAGPGDRDEVGAWTRAHWPNWGPEALRALDRGTLVLARGADGIRGVCAYDVNRAAMLGPIAVRPDLLGRGAGYPLLVGALHRMRERRYRTIEVSWVGPVVPYARVGGYVSRVFFVYRKTLG